MNGQVVARAGTFICPICGPSIIIYRILSLGFSDLSAVQH